MKIPQSVRNAYEELREKYIPLKSLVDNFVAQNKENEWHYFSRIKEAESFALKIESGRCKSIGEFEDFLAGTIVVENAAAIESAVELISKRFEVSHRRPERGDFTHKMPEAFPFDDLRLYVKWKDSLVTPPTGFEGLLFELQIKTFLQHAWSIATHDLIYKADEKNWAKERIAFQIKAMLEHAELSIFEADKLSASPLNKKTNKRSEIIANTIIVLRSLWEPADLPSNLNLLAANVTELITVMDIELEELRKAVEQDGNNGGGANLRNLSPYAVIIQALINHMGDKFVAYARKAKGRKIFVHSEIVIPSEMGEVLADRIVQF